MTVGSRFGTVDVEVGPGELVAIIGGDSSGTAGHDRITLRPGGVRGGLVSLARSGVAIVPAQLALFPSLTVSEHLQLGRVRRRRPDRSREVLGWMPELVALGARRAGRLSGGEQRLLAIARALAGSPRVVLVEDTTTGLSPRAVHRVAAALRSAADDWGTAVVAADHRESFLTDAADRVRHLRGTVGAGGGAAP